MKHVLATICAFAVLATSTLAEGHVSGCHSRKCDRRISAKRHRLFWVHRFHRFSGHEQSWARCIAYYETYGTPWRLKARVNTGNGYYGAMQFMWVTAQAAGFHRRPDLTSLHEQLVRAVLWAHRAGSSQWSTSAQCGSA